MAGGHHRGRHVQDDSGSVDQLDLVADADEGDGGALTHGDAKLVGEDAHDGGVLDPGNLFQFGTAGGQRDEEDVAADVGSEDGEQVFAGELAVADGLDGGGGVDAEAGVAIEEVADGDDGPDGCGGDGKRGEEKDESAPAGFCPVGQDAFADGDAAAGAQEGVVADTVDGLGGDPVGSAVSISPA